MTEPTNIADAITAAQGRVADCYTAVSDMGGTLPETQNTTNLPNAIRSIPKGQTILAYNETGETLAEDDRVLLRYSVSETEKTQEYTIAATGSSNGATYVQPVWFNNNLFCVFAVFNKNTGDNGSFAYQYDGLSWNKTEATGKHVISTSNANWCGHRFRWIDDIGMLCYVGAATGDYGNNKIIDSSGQFTSLATGGWSIVGKIGNKTYKTFYTTSSSDANRGVWADSTQILADVKIKGHYVDKNNALILITKDTTPHILKINSDGVTVDNDYASNDIGTAYFVGCTGLAPDDYVFFADDVDKEKYNNTSFSNWSIDYNWGTVTSSYSVYKIDSNYQLQPIEPTDTLYTYINIDKSLWRFDNRNNCLVIGTTNNVYVLEFNPSTHTWSLFASNMLLPYNDSNTYLYNAALSPDKRRLVVYSGDIWHYAQNMFIYDIKAKYDWEVADNIAQNYDGILSITGVATGDTQTVDNVTYDVIKVVLPPEETVTCTLTFDEETTVLPDLSII